MTNKRHRDSTAARDDLAYEIWSGPFSQARVHLVAITAWLEEAVVLVRAMNGGSGQRATCEPLTIRDARQNVALWIDGVDGRLADLDSYLDGVTAIGDKVHQDADYDRQTLPVHGEPGRFVFRGDGGPQ